MHVKSDHFMFSTFLRKLQLLLITLTTFSFGEISVNQHFLQVSALYKNSLYLCCKELQQAFTEREGKKELFLFIGQFQ